MSRCHVKMPGRASLLVVELVGWEPGLGGDVTQDPYLPGSHAQGLGLGGCVSGRLEAMCGGILEGPLEPSHHGEAELVLCRPGTVGAGDVGVEGSQEVGIDGDHREMFPHLPPITTITTPLSRARGGVGEGPPVGSSTRRRLRSFSRSRLAMASANHEREREIGVRGSPCWDPQVEGRSRQFHLYSLNSCCCS
jgi:hypothetical protein